MAKYISGQSLADIKAEDLNRYDRAAGVVLGKRGARPGSPPPSTSQPKLIVRNGSGAERAAYDCLAVSAPLFTPTENVKSFTRMPAFTVVEHTSTDLSLAVLTGPLGDGGSGHAVIYGQTAVKISVTAETADFNFAKATPGQTYLTPAASGPARIVWKEPGAGEKWAWVVLGGAADGDVHWQFTLTAPLSGGEATADQLDIEGEATGESITVKDTTASSMFSGLISGTNGWCFERGGDFYIIQAECGGGGSASGAMATAAFRIL